MRVTRLMAVETSSRRVAEFCRLRVTTRTRHDLMGSPELEIRKCVVERLAVQLDDIDVAAEVIRMTMVAVLALGLGLTPVKSHTQRTISGSLLVARQAEPRLCFSRKRLMAVAAILLELGVSRDDRPGHDKLLEQALRSRRRRHDAGDGDADCERAGESPVQLATLHLEEMGRVDVNDCCDDE